jgi:hypothetical protein
VFVDDVLREEGLYVRDIGVFLSDAAKNLTFALWSGPKEGVWSEGTVMEQVAHLPEQSFEKVMQAIPLKPVNYMFLGAPNLRQEIALGPSGDIRLLTNSLRAPGPDLDRRGWSFAELTWQFRSGTNPVFWGKDSRKVSRKLEQGWLPVATHSWTDDGVEFNQTSVATPLLTDISRLKSSNGCELVVLATRFTLSNTLAKPVTATLWTQLNHQRSVRLEPTGLLRVAEPSDGKSHAGLTPVRGRFQREHGRLELIALPDDPARKGAREAIRYTVELEPGQSESLELSVPYLELLTEAEVAALGRLRFAPTHEAVVSFWQDRAMRGMTIEVPDLFLNEFFKASLWHVLISNDIDPVTRHVQQGAATHHYRNYLNETMMVARALEMRGEHAEAAALLQPFIDSQGVKGLPGNFRTRPTRTRTPPMATTCITVGAFGRLPNTSRGLAIPIT